ncbi:DUF421 domain-containing protein [Halalkalibacter kiskunsagensis]|uniref:DUF421 domain-containing protein n=1 Tax=Halalkalibacter kiskunsagensis TaxID=1548599 RepID=A0ABV6KEX2_9BACI
MDFNWIWKAILIVIVGTHILRLAGRKSISQLTVSQTVIMISIGNLMIQPVSNRSIWVTFMIALILVLVLMALEYFQVKSDKFESFITGKEIIVIHNGVIDEQNLKKLRLTVDQLEVRLRQVNIAKISDVKIATIEPSGLLGYTLHEYAQPATKQDIQTLLNYIHSQLPASQPPPIVTQQQNNGTVFSEENNNQDAYIPPKHLQ